MIGLAIGCAAIGLIVGILVTDMLHRCDWFGGLWRRRVDGTRLRLANLPVGGVLLALVSLPEIVSWTPLGAACLGASIGMSVAAVGWGILADPLPPA